MKKILRLRKHPYIARVGIFLIAVALVVGGLSCVPYLAMIVIPVGGGTTSPLSGAQSPGPVQIEAVAWPGYQFAFWAGAPSGFALADNNPINTFNMPNSSVIITAFFVKLLDHFKCYTVAANLTGMGESVYLKDQFVTIWNATVTSAQYFGNPAMKWHNNVTTNISNPDHHLTVYNITAWQPPQTWQVVVVNQFGFQNLTVSGPVALAVPTWKLSPGNHTPPEGLDHFLLYPVINGTSVEKVVNLNDEFGSETQVLIYQPRFFANPVEKTHGGNVTNITEPEAHLVFYEIAGGSFQGEVVQLNNQFGNQTLVVDDPALLAVPSAKLGYEPIP